MSARIVFAACLLLCACGDMPPPCGYIREGDWVWHKPTGQVAQTDIYDGHKVQVRLPNGEWFDARCEDLEKRP